MHYARAPSPVHLAPLLLWKLSDRRHVLDARAAAGRAVATALQYELAISPEHAQADVVPAANTGETSTRRHALQGTARPPPHVRIDLDHSDQHGKLPLTMQPPGLLAVAALPRQSALRCSAPRASHAPFAHLFTRMSSLPYSSCTRATMSLPPSKGGGEGPG